MNTIARTIAILVVAGAGLVPQTVSGAGGLRTRGTETVELYKYLPALPADVPWLLADRSAPRTSVLPEAGSASALMLEPRPAQGWAPLTSQPAALRPLEGCKRC